ncbi:MAG: hypothetical protein DRP00_02840 [Candidatus Aenigmatarchaeota archaeon]|nr:MAG: hypothetical protein DRP00_02840 [Candidatus Aenigmarchaeota archaeon]
MKLSPILTMLDDLSKNIINYCSYFYILEYLVHYKGYYQLRDRLTWIAELLNDEITLYGIYSVSNELLNMSTEFRIETYKPLRQDKIMEVNYGSCCNVYATFEKFPKTHTLDTVYGQTIKHYEEENIPDWKARVDCCTKTQFDEIVLAIVDALCTISNYIRPKFPPEVQRVFCWWWLFAEEGIEWIQGPLELMGYDSVINQQVLMFFSFFGISEEEGQNLFKFLTKKGEDEVVNWVEFLQGVIVFEYVKEKEEITSKSFLSASQTIFSVQYVPDENTIGWRYPYGGHSWASIAGAIYDGLAKRFDIVHQVDIYFHLQHNMGLWFNKILTEEKTKELKRILDAKFEGNLKELYPYAVEVDPEITNFVRLLADIEVSKTAWLEKEKALKKEVETAVKLGVAPV